MTGIATDNRPAPTVHPQRFTAWSPNGGYNDPVRDKAARYTTPRKIEGGFARDKALQAMQTHLFTWGFYSFNDHLPWGCWDPGAMETDAWPNCAGVNPEEKARWAKLYDINEYVASTVLLYEMSVYHGKPLVMEVYFGGPECSPRLTTAFNNGRPTTSWYNRIDSSFKPVMRLRERGVPVRVWVDAAPTRPEGSQSHRLVNRLINTHGFETGIEGNIRLDTAVWANKAHIPVMIMEESYDRQDPDKFEDAKTFALPYSQYKGEIVVLVGNGNPMKRAHPTKPMPVLTTEQRMLEYAREGRSLAYVGAPLSYPSAEAFFAAARTTTGPVDPGVDPAKTDPDPSGKKE